MFHCRSGGKAYGIKNVILHTPIYGEENKKVNKFEGHIIHDHLFPLHPSIKAIKRPSKTRKVEEQLISNRHKCNNFSCNTRALYSNQPKTKNQNKNKNKIKKKGKKKGQTERKRKMMLVSEGRRMHPCMNRIPSDAQRCSP